MLCAGCGAWHQSKWCYRRINEATLIGMAWQGIQLPRNEERTISRLSSFSGRFGKSKARQNLKQMVSSVCLTVEAGSTDIIEWEFTWDDCINSRCSCFVF